MRKFYFTLSCNPMDPDWDAEATEVAVRDLIAHFVRAKDFVVTVSIANQFVKILGPELECLMLENWLTDSPFRKEDVIDEGYI